MVCSALLVAAPIALVLTEGPQAGSPRDPEGVFTGNPYDGTGLSLIHI